MTILVPGEAQSGGEVAIFPAWDHISLKRWRASHALAQPLDCCWWMADRVLDWHDWRRRGLAHHADADCLIWLAAGGRSRNRPAVRFDHEGHGGVAPSKAREHRLGDLALARCGQPSRRRGFARVALSSASRDREAWPSHSPGSWLCPVCQ